MSDYDSIEIKYVAQAQLKKVSQFESTLHEEL